MPTIRNVSPTGDLDVPLLRQVVKAGESVTVSVEHAERLLPQDIWEAVDKAALRIQSVINGSEPAVAEEGVTE